MKDLLENYEGEITRINVESLHKTEVSDFYSPVVAKLWSANEGRTVRTVSGYAHQAEASRTPRYIPALQVD